MTKRILTQILPTYLSLWGLGLALGVLSADKLLQLAPPMRDVDVFRPGALMLLEGIRLHRVELSSALLRATALFALGYVSLLVVRARLYAVLVDAHDLRASRNNLFSRAPGSVLVTLFQGVLLLLVLIAGVIGANRLPSLGGTMTPSRLGPLVAFSLAIGIIALAACAFCDLYRLSLFHTAGWRGHFSKVLATLKRSLFALIGARALRAAAVLIQAPLALQLTTRPLAPGIGGAVGSFILMQSLVLCTLMTEVWWLSFANEKLRAATTQRCDTPERDDARRGPSPNPDASPSRADGETRQIGRRQSRERRR